MRLTKKMIAIGAASAAVAAGGVGTAVAVSGDGENVTGADAERAKAAALDAVPGAVTEIEFQDGDGPGTYEVEVRRDDGSELEVNVDDNFEVLGTAPDDESGADDDAEGDDD